MGPPDAWFSRRTSSDCVTALPLANRLASRLARTAGMAVRCTVCAAVCEKTAKFYENDIKKVVSIRTFYELYRIVRT